ncbi:MAG: HEPN domain-containing protein [Methanocella sp.]
MADTRIPRDFKDCKDFGKVAPFPINEDTIRNELKQVDYDLATAKKLFTDGNYKWATTAAYYSMFLSARTALLSRGYRDKKHNSHLCLSHFLGRLVDLGYLKKAYSNDFQLAMDMRERANYSGAYSREDAEKAISYAEDFKKQMEAVIDLKGMKI